MTCVRSVVSDGGLSRISRAGDIIATAASLTTIATDANQTLTWAQMSGGLVQFTSFSAGRQVTTDTAVNILAANPWMDVGDSFEVYVSCQTAFAATWVAGAGVTLAGRATTAASGSSRILVTKTGAAAVTWNVL